MSLVDALLPDARSAFLEVLDTGLTGAMVRFRIGNEELPVGRDSAAEFRIRVHRPRFFTQVLSYGNLGLAESFMHGDFEMESGCLHDFLTVLLRSRIDEAIRKRRKLALKVASIRLWNSFRTRETNVRRHYDLGNDLFESFLDPTLTYSCGYAQTPVDSLEKLQANKLQRICRKLRLQPGNRMLDIGCGFGGLLILAAENFGIEGTGITISRAQHERATAEVERRGLSDRIKIELREYRHIRKRYDRIASVGMMEHVPRREYDEYFRVIAQALNPGGIGLVHTIGCSQSRNEHDPFIQKYIFPGSNQPRLSEIAKFMEKRGLAILDVENIVRHYSYTMHGWLLRFQQNRSHLDSSRYDAVFQRMWEYYLSCGIAAARATDAAVYQVLFSNDRAADLPLKRV
jgi:cyclopropane-fatty-acyl-phospholipid synthase